MSIPKFALTGWGMVLAMGVGVVPMPLVWAQAAGVPVAAAASPAGPAGTSQGQAPVVYRCPGPPVLYTDTLSPQEARSKNCKPLTDLPVAVAPAPAPMPKPVSAQPASPGSVAAASSLGATGSTSPVGTAVAGGGAAPAAGFVTPPPGGSRIGAAGVAPGPAAGAVPSSAAAVAGGGTGTGTGTASTAAVALPDARIRPDDQRSRDAEARRILEAELRREEARLNDAIKASGTAKPGERVGADAAQIRRAESDIEAIRRELGRLR